MAPLRSRKRNSTIQALDILNNVGNANHHSARSRVQRPSRRQLQPEVQIPQSDDIWDIPNSPEKRQDTRRRIADSEPVTPRRSARYRPQLEQTKADNASSGEWLGSRTWVNYKEGDKGIEDGKDKDGNEEEYEEDSNEDSEENEENEEGDLRLFSEDDTPKTKRSSRPSSRKQADTEEFPDLPSPSALFRGDGFLVSSSAPASEQSSDASESQDSDSGEEDPDAPKNTQKPDTSKAHSEEESGSSEESSEDGDESSSEKASKPSPSQPRPVVLINQAQETSQGLSSPRSARHMESMNNAATRKTNETPTQQQTYNESNQEEGSSGSSYETEDGESDSSSSYEESTEHSPDEDDLPVPRQSKRRRVEPKSRNRRQSLRVQKAASSLGDQEVEDTRGQSQSDSEGDNDNDEEEDEEKDEEEGDNEVAKEAEKAREEENARKLQWMEQAMSLGQQRNNWLVVNSKAKELKRMADPSLAKYFVYVCTAIRELRGIYLDMVDTPPSHADLVQCDNLLASIPREGDGLLDQAYHMATQDSNFSDEEEHARDLVDEFEARVLPDMVKLLFACFQVYYTNPMMFPGLHGHFRRVLILLRRFCDRTTSMKMQRIVRGVVRTKGLDRALHALLKGLDSRALRPKRASARIAEAGNQREDTEIANGHEREWSQDEGLALIDGLQAYQGKCWKRDDPFNPVPCPLYCVLTLHPGPDRYLQIIGHFGYRLRHRTQQELRAKALQVHDRMQPTIAAQLETEDGRRPWGWLLSVRDS